jgi:hypothetical protein
VSGLPSKATPRYLRHLLRSKQPKVIIFANPNEFESLRSPRRTKTPRCGARQRQPQVSFVPDKSKDAEDCTVQTLKIELANGVKSQVTMWEGLGIPEQFMQHMIAMRDALEGMGLFKKV